MVSVLSFGSNVPGWIYSLAIVPIPLAMVLAQVSELVAFKGAAPGTV
jgi:hypothetical protein